MSKKETMCGDALKNKTDFVQNQPYPTPDSHKIRNKIKPSLTVDTSTNVSPFAKAMSSTCEK